MVKVSGLNIIKLTLFSLLLVFLGFLIWMNLTPGHFRYDCGCNPKRVVVYIQDDLTCEHIPNIAICGAIPEAKISGKLFLEAVLLNLAKLDFNK